MHTFMKMLSKLDSQSSRLPDLASVPVSVVLRLMVSPVSGWRWGSTRTLWHTSLSKDAVRSWTSLCLRTGPPLRQFNE